MTAVRFFCSSMLLAGTLCAQGTSAAVEAAFQRFQQATAKVEGPLWVEFQLVGAQSLQPKYPALAGRLIDPVLADLRAGKLRDITPGSVRALANASPVEAMDVVPFLPAGSRDTLIYSFLQANRTRDAVTVFRGALAAGELPMQPAGALLKQLMKDDPAQARSLFEQMTLSLGANPDPYAAWQMVLAADTMAKLDPKAAADACAAVLAAAAKLGYGDGKTKITAHFGSVVTSNSRDTLLVAAGSRLRELDPKRLDAFSDAIGKLDLSQPAAKSVTFSSGPAVPRPAEFAAISKKASQLRGNLSDAERASLAIEVAGEIDGLFAGAGKLDLARGLANLSTEGDLGAKALAAVSATYARALHEHPGNSFDYVTLASLVRYEHVPPPAFEEPAEKAAEALLELRNQILQTAGFTLTALDGKTYSLAALRGKVVLLNFWATWCPPCRKEMPDMEKLSHAFAGKGLVVLAVSDEDRDTVAPFIQKQKYTFPILLDPDRKVHSDFSVEGIPKTFIFDREGRLAEQAIDMRTEAQFLELLKRVGI